MAETLGAAVLELRTDDAKMQKGIRGARESTERLDGRLRGLSGNMERNLSRPFAAMSRRAKIAFAAVAAASTAMAGAFVRSSLRSIDANAKFAQSLDTSVSSMQILKRAAELAGISQGDLEGSLRRMTRRLSLAEVGTGAAVKALEALNLSASDLADIPADERVEQIISRIREMIPVAQQAGVASQIFGDRSGLAMLRIAETTEQAREEIDRFGAAVSDVGAAKIEAANDALSGVGLAARGLANQATVALAPALTAIAERLQAITQSFAGLPANVRRFISVLGTAAAGAAAAAVALGAVAIALGAMSTPLLVVIGAVTAAGGLWAALATNTDTASEATRAAKEAQENLNAALGVFNDTAAPGAAKAAIEAANANFQLADSAVAAARAELAKREAQLQKLDDLAKGTSLSELKNLPPDERLEVIEQVTRGRNIARQAATAAEEELLKVRRSLEIAESARNRTARQVTGATSEAMSETVKQSRDLTVTIEGLGNEGENTGTKLGGAFSGLSEEIEAAGGDLGQFNRGLRGTEEIARRVESATKSAFSSFVTGASSAKDALVQLIDRLNEIAASRIFDNLSNSLSDSFGGDGFFSSIANAIFGPGQTTRDASALSGLSGAQLLPSRAGGGPLARGQTALVGERGPELFTPRSAGIVTPNSRIGGGVVVNINNTGEPLEARQTNTRQGPDGQTIVDVAVEGSLARLGARGKLDGLFGTFGAQRRGVK